MLPQQTSQQWKYVFLITAGMTFVCGMVFMIFGSSEEQSWNKLSKSVEMKPLNESKSKKTACEKMSE